MAYKFQRGAAVASGSFTAEEGLVSSTDIQAKSGNLSGSAALLVGTSATVGNGLTVTAGGAQVTGAVNVNGAISGSSTLQVGGVSTLQALNAQATTATTLSASSTLQVGGTSTLQTLNAQATTTTTLSGTVAQMTTLSASSLGGAAVSNLSANYYPSWNLAAGQLVNGYLVDQPGTGVKLSASAGVASFDISNGSLTASAGLKVTSGGALISAGGLTVTAGGATVTAGGLTVTAGGAAVNGGNLTVGAGYISASSTIEAGSSITASAGVKVTTGGVNVLAGGLTVSAGDSSVQKLTVNGDLIVLGDTFSASVGTLLIEDKQIVLADGAANASLAYGAGFFVSGANVEWTFKQNGEGTAASSGDIFVASSSAGLIDIQAASFYGSFVGSFTTPVQAIGDENKNLALGVNYSTASLTAIRTWNLPAASVGDSVKIKAPANCGNAPSGFNIIIAGGSATIDGESTVTLESPYAAIECVYVATNTWSVF